MEAERARRSLRDFMRQAWPLVDPAPFKPNWHIDCLAEHLQAVFYGQIRRLVVSMPPRHCKSLSACVFFHPWCWINQASMAFIFTSYAEEYCTRDAVKARLLIGSDWYRDNWPHVQVRPDEDTKRRYVNTAMGYRVSTSVGGKGTGEGADVVVGDDMHKINEIESTPIREGVIEFWSKVMGTRGNDPATVRRLVIMHRLAEDDVAGHCLSQDMGYEYLCMPARHDPSRMVYSLPPGEKPHEYRKKNPDAIIPTSLQMAKPELRDPRTKEGELLWPGHFGPKEIAEVTLEVGPWGAASMLDQRPNALSSKVISNFRYFEEIADFVDGHPVKIFRLHRADGSTKHYYAHQLRWFQTCDTALKKGQENDNTACGTYAQTPENELLIYDMACEKLEVPHQMGFMVSQRLRHPYVMFQAVEDKASGTGLIQAARLKGMPFRTLKADEDKVRRASTLATMYENNMVYHLAGAPWLVDYEEEIRRFPKGRKDDRLDCSAYAALLITTDALLAQDVTVEDMMVYPGITPDGRRVEEMDSVRRDAIYGDWDEGARPYEPPPAQDFGGDDGLWDWV